MERQSNVQLLRLQNKEPHGQQHCAGSVWTPQEAFAICERKIKRAEHATSSDGHESAT